MADLMTDNRTDCAEIRCVVGLWIKEGRLKDSRGENNFVHRRVVVGIDRLRCHMPFTAIDGATQLIPATLNVEPSRGLDSINKGKRLDLQRRVVDPTVGVANLRGESGEFLKSCSSGLFTHPVACGQSPVIGLKERMDKLVHDGLVFRREVARDPNFTHGLAEEGRYQGESTLPARAKFLGP